MQPGRLFMAAREDILNYDLQGICKAALGYQESANAHSLENSMVQIVSSQSPTTTLVIDEQHICMCMCHVQV